MLPLGTMLPILEAPRTPASFKEGTAHPLKAFQRMLGLIAAASTGTSVRSALHATYPVLAEAEGSIRGLASRTPPRNGDSGLCISPGPVFHSMHSLQSLCYRRYSGKSGNNGKTHSNSPPLEEPAMGVGVIPTARSSPVT